MIKSVAPKISLTPQQNHFLWFSNDLRTSYRSYIFEQFHKLKSYGFKFDLLDFLIFY